MGIEVGAVECAFSMYDHMVADFFRELKRRWKGLPIFQKRLVIVEVVLIIDILIGWTVCCFLDSTSALIHITVGICLASIIYLIFQRYIRWFNMLVVKRANKRDPTKWTTYALSSVLFFLIYLLPIYGLIKIPLSLFFLYSFCPLMMAPFKDAHEGTNLSALLLLSGLLLTTHGWVSGIIVGSVTIPALIYVLLQKDIQEDEEFTEAKIAASKRLLLSLFKILVMAVMTAAFVYAIILCMNTYWPTMAKNDPDSINKYAFLVTQPKDVNLHATKVKTLEDLEPYRKLTERVVIKPNICTTESINIRICDSYDCLRKYMEKDFARRSSCSCCAGDRMSYVIQDYCPKTEFSFFYFKYPYYGKGTLLSTGKRSAAVQDRKQRLTHQLIPKKYVKHESEKVLKRIQEMFDRAPGLSGGIIDMMVEDPDALESTPFYLLDVNPFPLRNLPEFVEPDDGILTRLLKSLRTTRTFLMEAWIGLINLLGYEMDRWTMITHIQTLIRRARFCGQLRLVLAVP